MMSSVRPRGAVAGALLACLVAACSLSSEAQGTPSPSATATPPPGLVDAQRTIAQHVADQLIGSLPNGSVRAAAYATTTSNGYVATLPDNAGFPTPPAGSDVVIVVEIEGWWPAPHSCIGPCFDTGALVAYDVTTQATLQITYENDPWSGDRPSPGPSVSERFQALRQWGAPIPLHVSG